MRKLKRSECAVLPLVLIGKWFDMIARGEKREEYRACTEYWRKRIWNWEDKAKGPSPEACKTLVVEFRRGYASNAPRMAFSAHIRAWRREPNHPEWGEPYEPHYVIALDERVELEGDK